MPWKQHKGGYQTKNGGHIKKPSMYERLRAKGMSKSKAAVITNSKSK